MDKLKIKEYIKQPLEGLLYDLDLLPEQCKTIINELRNVVIECQYKEIEQLREEKEWLVKLILSDYRTYNIEELKKIIIEKMPQALKEGEREDEAI